MNEKISDEGVVSTEQTDALDLGKVRYLAELVARKALSPNVRKLAYDALALIAEVERLTQQRDSAREWAVRLEQQNAEALRLVNETLDRAPGFGEWVFMDYLRNIQRFLGVFPDDETEHAREQQQ